MHTHLEKLHSLTKSQQRRDEQNLLQATFSRDCAKYIANMPARIA